MIFMYTSKLPEEYNTIKRNDRAISDDQWIRSFLENSPFGMIATVYQEQPFAHINLFTYDPDGHCLYIHNAENGRIIDNINTNNRVCFTVSEMGRLLPAKKACKFSVEYASVVIFGTAEILQNLQEKIYGFNLLMKKYFPQYHAEKDYRPIDIQETKRTAVIKININNWSGKRNQPKDKNPEAFSFNKLINDPQRG
jgi:uncharacterized protein